MARRQTLLGQGLFRDFHNLSWWKPAQCARYLVLVFFLAITDDSANATSLKTLLKALNMSVSSSGMIPPEFSTLTSTGSRVSLNSLKGNIVLISFWATWCRECRVEMPALEQLHRELGNRGLSVLGVNLREDARVVRRYAQELNLTFPQLLDLGGKIKNAFGVLGLPTTFLVGRRGQTIGFAVGPREWDRPPARSLVERLLAKPQP